MYLTFSVNSVHHLLPQQLQFDQPQPPAQVTPTTPASTVGPTAFSVYMSRGDLTVVCTPCNHLLLLGLIPKSLKRKRIYKYQTRVI